MIKLILLFSFIICLVYLIRYTYINKEKFVDLTLKKRCLITDILFPTKFSKWRLVEIFSFIEKYDTDILVINRINNFADNIFPFDYEEIKDKFNLNSYDILIFNPEYNWINKFNNDFDGIKFNNKHKSDYLFRKKKFRNEIFNVINYDFIYHIFLMNYINFNQKYNYPFKNQFIHLYPGGGITDKNILENLENIIHPDVNIIVTQNFISKNIKRINKIELFGGPFYFEHENNKIKKKDNSNVLTICFTSLGNHISKGSNEYIQIVNLYKEKYQSDLVKFISIGPEYLDNTIKSLPSMSQYDLDDYYNNNVDIVINLTTGKEIDGFPLGIESILNGCILLTTDTFNMNKSNNFNYNEFIIINKDNIEDIVNKIKMLYDDKNFYNKLLQELQNKVYELYNYNNMFIKRFDFIDSNLIK